MKDLPPLPLQSRILTDGTHVGGPMHYQRIGGSLSQNSWDELLQHILNLLEG